MTMKSTQGASFKHTDLDAAESEYERKLARQQQFDQMEAALAGISYPETQYPNTSIRLSNSIRFWDENFGDEDDDEDSQSRSSTSKIKAPDGAIESARRFLWDEDDDTDNYVASSRPSSDNRKNVFERYLERWTDCDSKKVVSKKSTSVPNEAKKLTWKVDASSLPAWLSPKDANRNPRKLVANLAPRRFSTRRHLDAHDSESERSPDDHTLLEHLSSWCDNYFLAMYHCFLGIVATICEYGTACLSHIPLNICVIFIFSLLGVGIFIFSLAVLTSHKSAPDGADNVTTLPSSGELPNSDKTPIKNMVRYEALRQTILDSAFTSSSTLDLLKSPQSHALHWLTDQDPAQLRHDDDALLQRYALATFYFSTYAFVQEEDDHLMEKLSPVGISNEWTHMDNWMSEKGICIWFGVSCIPHLRHGEEEFSYDENSNVLRLNLTENNVRGVIPSELSALEDLISLDLSRNELWGSIPASVGTLAKLREIYFGENILTGNIPTQLGAAKALRDLFLGSNQLTGTIPDEIGYLTLLRALALDQNLLTGSIPLNWKSQHLILLYLDTNHLNGTIPTGLQHLTELIDLRLGKNALSGSIPSELSGLSDLEFLYLDNNYLLGSLPDIWSKLSRLQELQLYKNNLTGTLPDSISALRNLKILYFDSNDFSGPIPASYGSLEQLEMLYLYGNKIKGTIPTEIGRMSNLKDLYLSDNLITGSIPSELGKCYRLEKFEAQSNRLTGRVPSEIGLLESLEGMKVHLNYITGFIPSQICNARNLYQLDVLVADCSLGDGGTLNCECCSSCFP